VVTIKLGKMKTLKLTVFVLVCLFTANLSMAIAPKMEDVIKEKSEVINKIRKSVAYTEFVPFMKCGQLEQIVLRCKVNENCEVVVSKIIGHNEDLKKAVRRRMKKKIIKTSKALCGQDLALRLSFKKYKR